jgi:hypothetical protein
MRTQRTIGVILLACVLGAVVIWVALVWALEPLVGTIVGVGVAVLVVAAYVLVIGPWQRRWGATDEEARAWMPGDGLLPPGVPGTTRGITVGTTPDRVYPWLLQIGYGRGGWYSYDWIDNDGRPSVDRIDPALQTLGVGDTILMLPGMGPTVKELVPNHYVVSGGERDSWCLLVKPIEGGRTRLISRWRQDWEKGVGTFVWTTISDPGAFVMERKMLRTLRDLAERHANDRVGT